MEQIWLKGLQYHHSWTVGGTVEVCRGTTARPSGGCLVSVLRRACFLDGSSPNHQPRGMRALPCGHTVVNVISNHQLTVI